MSELKKAIEEITYRTKQFPEKAFKIISENREEVIPYLREAVKYANDKRTEIGEDYMLHFYALYLLGQFQDKDFFSDIVEFVSMPSKDLDFLIGDSITSGLNNILYNTFDGNLELLKKSIQNWDIDEYVRSAMLEVMGQWYLDGNLAENEWKDLLKQIIYGGKPYDYLYNAVGEAVCRCHFVDMLPDIRYMLDNNLVDEFCVGKYDSYVDYMFEYREWEENFCTTPMDAADILRNWAMFRDEEGDKPSRKQDFEKAFRAFERELNPPVKKVKIGRNDPCPCGSGKKYKFCCMNKPKEEIDLIENPEERQKWLKDYPYTGKERMEGRVYLDDYFDRSSIEIDQIIYLGMMHRPGLIWNRNIEVEEERTRKYLYLAFQKCVARMDEEQIESFSDYDEKYSIHYRSEEWIGKLLELLKESNDTQTYKEVKERLRS